MAEGSGFLSGVLHHPLGAGRARKSAIGYRLGTGFEELAHLRAQRVEVRTEIRQDLRAHRIFLAYQGQKDMLGADVAVVQSARLLLGDRHDFLGSLGQGQWSRFGHLVPVQFCRSFRRVDTEGNVGFLSGAERYVHKSCAGPGTNLELEFGDLIARNVSEIGGGLPHLDEWEPNLLRTFYDVTILGDSDDTVRVLQ